MAPKVGIAELGDGIEPRNDLVPFDIRVPSLEALHSLDLIVNLPLSSGAPIESYDHFAIQLELYYNNILIQWSDANVRVSPAYSPNAQHDVVFFTGAWLSKDSFHLWELLFRKLGLTYQMWDLDFIGHFTHKTEEDGSKTTWVRPGGAPDRRILLMPVPRIAEKKSRENCRIEFPWREIIERPSILFHSRYPL